MRLGGSSLSRFELCRLVAVTLRLPDAAAYRGVGRHPSQFQVVSIFHRQSQETIGGRRGSIGQSSSPRISRLTTRPTGRTDRPSREGWPPEPSPFVGRRKLLESEIRRTEVVRRGIIGYDRHGTKKGKRGREKTYKEATRSVVRAGNKEGMRAEAWTIRGGATAFDAELSALVRAIELCFLRRAPGIHFRIFTDSQVAMRRILDDSPGPGHAMAVRGIIGATRTCQSGAVISVHWVPGHAGVTGNEIADQWASEAAARELGASRGVQSGLIRPDRGSAMTSKSFLRAVLRRRAVDSWREEIISKGKRGRPYQVPIAGEVPRIPRALQRTRVWHLDFFNYPRDMP